MTLDEFKILVGSNTCYCNYRVEYMADDGVWDIEHSAPTLFDAYDFLREHPDFHCKQCV